MYSNPTRQGKARAETKQRLQEQRAVKNYRLKKRKKKLGGNSVLFKNSLQGQKAVPERGLQAEAGEKVKNGNGTTEHAHNQRARERATWGVNDASGA